MDQDTGVELKTTEYHEKQSGQWRESTYRPPLDLVIVNVAHVERRTDGQKWGRRVLEQGYGGPERSRLGDKADLINVFVAGS